MGEQAWWLVIDLDGCYTVVVQADSEEDALQEAASTLGMANDTPLPSMRAASLSEEQAATLGLTTTSTAGENEGNAEDDNLVFPNVFKYCSMCGSEVVTDTFNPHPICISCRDEETGE